MCKQESSTDESTKICTIKELVMMETMISDFNTRYYIPVIQKLACYLPHVRILGKNHCGAMQHTAFKRRGLFQYFLCRSDYSERLVASFAHQMQSEHYGGNISVYIEGISLGNFGEIPTADINSTIPSRQHNAVFHFFIL